MIRTLTVPRALESIARLAVVLVVTSCATLTAVAQDTGLILRGGRIYTPSGWAEAVAIRDGVIVAVGDEASVMSTLVSAAEVRDLDGAVVLPGLQDKHVHPTGAGLLQQQCMFPQGSAAAQIEAAVAACAAQRTDGEWIQGGQWDAASFGSAPMDRVLLDRAAPRNPVALMDISAHSLWVNSAALEIAGIDASTPNPAGGIFERSANGRPTGILREAASGLVRRHIPPPTVEQAADALRWALQIMLSFGITSFTDALVDETSLRAYALLADREELKQRVTGCLAWSGRGGVGGVTAMPEFIQLRNLYTRERFSPSCIKLLLDGVPTDAHTAAMVEPYADAAGLDGERAKGLLMVPAPALNALVTELDGLGFVVKMHAAGDGAVRAGLDAIEAARDANGFSGLLHEVAHNSFVQMDDIRRARAIAATFEMSPYIWYPNPIIPDIAKAVGAERMRRWIPVKDAIDAGALVVPGSDWAVVPSVNPWIAIETLVTRRAPGGKGEPLAESEAIDIGQAIDLFTINAARQAGIRSRLGTIERGMLADLVVIDRNPFEVPITDVHATEVLLTLIGGEIVYRSMSHEESRIDD